ncbi:aspartyl protease family protein [Flammeovirga aprica]|uniref:PDZ domain-containing protein n=1 Tax=Flammeovirga aprica JL-4 TaxID=694437 RepID=A0A7X9P0P5_9BACT|nr:aspartyl protease family protein [Flammeovirga aprica]NME67401.1 PDZ domain-containing protein [Flammeovirga aprica JL-4]
MFNSKTILFFLLFFTSIGCNRKFVSVINSGHTQENFRTVIPFETKMGLIILQAKIKDESYRFIFDTGAPACIISPEIMKEIGADIITSQKIYDVNNHYQINEFTKVSSIEIGNTIFSDIGTMILDLKSIPTVKCLDADGLLGSNLFRHATWYIDYERKEIVIANDLASLEKPLEGFSSVKFFEGFGGVPAIFTYLNGKKILDTTIDFGYGGTVCLSEKVMKHVPDTKFWKGYGVAGIGLYGDEIPSETYKGDVDLFSLGNGLDFQQEKVHFDGERNNLVGSGIFKYYHVILDWNNKKIQLKRNNISRTAENDFGYSYGYNKEDGNVYVKNLYERSEASEKGIQLKDKIISVNGENLEAISEDEWCNFRSDKDQSAVRVLVIEREGERKEVILGKSI